jgi:hypothetical protein
MLAKSGDDLVAFGVEGRFAAQNKPDLVLAAVRVQVGFTAGGHDLDARVEMIGAHQASGRLSVLQELRLDGECLELCGRVSSLHVIASPSESLIYSAHSARGLQLYYHAPA